MKALLILLALLSPMQAEDLSRFFQEGSNDSNAGWRPPSGRYRVRIPSGMAVQNADDLDPDMIVFDGQTRGVQVFKLQIPGTVEDRIAGIIENKLALSDALIEESPQGLKGFSRKQLLDLLNPNIELGEDSDDEEDLEVDLDDGTAAEEQASV